MSVKSGTYFFLHSIQAKTTIFRKVDKNMFRVVRHSLKLAQKMTDDQRHCEKNITVFGHEL